MKHFCLKYIEVSLNRQREVYLPEIMDISGREVTTIIPILSPSFSGLPKANYKALFLNVTEMNGQTKIIDNMPLSLLSDDAEQGCYFPINRSIDLRNCYLFNPSLEDGVVSFVLSYVKRELSSTTVECNRYTSVDNSFEEAKQNAFPSIERLRGVVFGGVEVGENVCTLLNGDVQVSGFEHLFLTLQKGQSKVFDRVPFTLLRQKKYYEKMKFAPVSLNLDDSFIEVGQGGSSGNCSLIFTHS